MNKGYIRTTLEDAYQTALDTAKNSGYHTHAIMSSRYNDIHADKDCQDYYFVHIFRHESEDDNMMIISFASQDLELHVCTGIAEEIWTEYTQVNAGIVNDIYSDEIFV